MIPAIPAPLNKAIISHIISLVASPVCVDVPGYVFFSFYNASVLTCVEDSVPLVTLSDGFVTSSEGLDSGFVSCVDGFVSGSLGFTSEPATSL